ncbi:MAG: hypothetical protein NC337_12470 [Roseburia sp.]|nr:hypothetical protein [Roseburia sp.]
MAGQYTIDRLCSKIAESYSYTGSYSKRVVEADDDIQSLQKNIEEFRKSVKDLKKYTSGVTSKARLEKQLKKLADSYNDMKKTSGSVTDKELCKKLSKLDELISGNERALKKIGIEKSGDKLTLDKEALEDATDAELDSLFSGRDSFIDKIDKVMRDVDKDAANLEYETVTRRISRTVKYDKDKVDLVTSLNSLRNTVFGLQHFADVMVSGSMSENDRTAMNAALEEFRQLYNLNVEDRESLDEGDALKTIKTLCMTNEEQLNRIGLSFNPGDGRMEFSGNGDVSDADFKAAYLSLFSEENDASFGAAVTAQCQNVFYSVIKPNDIGVTIINEYA